MRVITSLSTLEAPEREREREREGERERERIVKLYIIYKLQFS